MPLFIDQHMRSGARRSRDTLMAAIMMMAIVLGACHRDTAGPDERDTPVATTIEITDPGLVRDGDTIVLTARVKDQRGRPLPTVSVQFAVTDPTVAVVGPGNVLIALRDGSTELVAVAGALEQRRPLLVVLHPVTDLDVPPAPYALFVHAQQRIPVVVRGLGGRILTDRPLTWRSSNPAVARVDDTGLVTATGPGEATVTVRHGTFVRGVPVQVAAYATRYRVASIEGRVLPVNVHEERVTRDDGSSYTLIERLEAGQLSIGPRYELSMTIADIERYELQGNVIDRVMRRRTVRDEGALAYNWLDASAWLQSSTVGGLTHSVRTEPDGPRLFFRIAGTNAVWALGLREPQ